MKTLGPKFHPGKIVATPAALEAMDAHGLVAGTLLVRHLKGDWGDICAEDRRENELSLQEGFRLMSVYKQHGTVIWVITEADRSVTTFLMPEDY